MDRKRGGETLPHVSDLYGQDFFSVYLSIYLFWKDSVRV